MWRAILYLLSVGCVVAQPPLIYNRKILNAASYVPQGVPAGSIARGSTFDIFGERIGPTPAVQVSQYPLTTTLGNVSITVTQGTTVVNAIPTYVSATQIIAIMPSNAPLGQVSVRVTYNNFRSNPMTTTVAATGFGIFTARGTGFGPGSLQNFVTPTSQPTNSATVAAKPGQTIILWGTGLGAVTSDVISPPSGLPATPVEVFVGGIAASVGYSGRTGCCAGIDQIIFTVPSNAPLGCWVPVVVRTAGVVVSNFVSMAITSDGSSCFDAFPPLPFVRKGNYGAVMLGRASTHQDIGTKAPIDVTVDYQTSFGLEILDSAFPFHTLFSWPPAGTCTSFSVKGDVLHGDSVPDALPAITPSVLTLGVTISGPKGTKVLPGFAPGLPYNTLGASLSNLIPNTLFLDPGSYQLIGTGSAGSGTFSAAINTSTPLVWTNRDQLTTVDRTKPLTIAWTGPASAQTVAVVGFGVDLPTNITTAFGCLAPKGATSFTIPPLFLANVPKSQENPLKSKGIIYLVGHPDASYVDLKASGLDASFASFTYINGKTVQFQ